MDDNVFFHMACSKDVVIGTEDCDNVIANDRLSHVYFNQESPAQFENRIKPQVYEGALRVVPCTKKLHFVSRNWHKEN